MNSSKTNSQTQEKPFIDSETRAEDLEKECQQQATGFAPIPLQREVIKPKPFPFEALGSLLGTAAKRMHEVIQAPDGTCGQSVLSALSLVCQAFIDVQIEDRVYPTSLYLITISDSGERKSATDKVALKPLHEWQKMLVKQYRKQFSEYKTIYELWKRKREQALRAAVENNKDHNLIFCDEPKPPCEGLMLCDEPTIEGLEQLLEKGQPSVGIFSDEAGRLVGGHAMNADNALKTACGLSNLWDGKPFTKVRKGDGSKIFYGRRLSMHLMMQPIVLHEILGNRLLMGQGILARCMFTAPLPLSGTRTYQEVDLGKDAAILAYYDLLNRILDRPYPKQCSQEDVDDAKFNPGDALEPARITLDAEAKTRWIMFHNETDKKMAANGLYFSIKPFASKAAEQVLRISALFSFSEQLTSVGSQPKISIDHVNRAILLVEFYLNETLRIMGCSVSNPDVALAILVLEWLKKSRQEQIFSITDVYQNGPSQIRDAELAKRIMKILESYHQVIPMQGTIINGAKVKMAWKLNS